MIKRSQIFQRSLSILSPLLLTCLLGACRSDQPAPEPAADAAQQSATTTPGDSTAGMSAAIPPGDSAGQEMTIIAPGPGEPGSTQGWQRAELVQGVQRFITAIDSNDSEMFWQSLSQRSLAMADRGGLATRDEIWTAARQTLGNIERRRITVIGGRADSVALRIDGLRMIDSMRVDDPVIVHLLREQGDWKVMYPGLLYPQHHLRK